MKKSSKLALVAGLIGAAMNLEMTGEERPTMRTKLTDEQKQERDKANKEYQRLRKGIEAFKYGETVIYARNKKNADRKAKNQGLI